MFPLPSLLRAPSEWVFAARQPGTPDWFPEKETCDKRLPQHQDYWSLANSLKSLNPHITTLSSDFISKKDSLPPFLLTGN